MAQAPRSGGLLSSIPGMMRSAGERAGGLLSGIGPATTGLRQRAAGSGLLNGLVAASNAAIGSDAYTSARNDRERRAREAAEAEAAARQRELEMGAARAMLGGWVGGTVPVSGQPGAPMPMPGPATAGLPAPMGAGPPPVQQPVAQEVDPATGRTVDVVTVQGGAVRRPGPPPPPFVPNWRAAVDFRLANGDYVGAARAAGQGQAMERQMATQSREMALADSARVGSFLAPLIRVPMGTGAASQQAFETSIDNALLAARAAGIVVPPEVENVLTDTGIPVADRVRFVQGLAFQADPEAVARQSAELGFAPFGFEDGQDRLLVTDARTGAVTDGPVYGVPAETTFREQQANARNAADNATQRAIASERTRLAIRLAEINRSTTLTVEQKRDARAAATRQSNERIAVITGRTLNDDEEMHDVVTNPVFAE